MNQTTLEMYVTQNRKSTITNAEIVRQYQAGMFKKQIARTFHVSIIRVREAIKDAGL